MSTVYAARLVGAGSNDPRTSFDKVREIAARWAGLSSPHEIGRTRNHRNGETIVEHFVAPDDESEAWTLRLHHPDATEPSVRWGTFVSVHRDEAVDVRIELDRTRIDGTVTTTNSRPAPPRLVRELLESNVEFEDGGRPISNEPIIVRSDDVEEFADLVLSPERKLPVFGYTGRDDDPIDAEPLFQRLRALVHIAFVTDEASWKLNDLLPEGFNVYGGAARLWWPKLLHSSSRQDRWNHPLWTRNMTSDRIAVDVSEKILDAAIGAWMPDTRVLRLRRAVAMSDIEKRDTEIEKLRHDLSRLERETPTSAESHVLTDERTRLDELTSEQIKQLSKDNDNYFEEIVRLEAELERASTTAATASEAQQAATRLNQELLFLMELKDELLARATTGPTEGARPRDYKLGPAFLSFVEQLGPEFRPKVIKACVDMIVNSPGLRQRRDDHELRSGPGPHDPAYVRSTDGATARRCSIEQNRASARRLHYWVIDSDNIEFASVVIHDRMGIPE